MKFDIIAFVVVASAFAAALAIFSWLLGAHAPDLTPARLFLEADIIAKMVLMLVNLLTLPVLVLGIVGLVSRGAAAPMARLLRLAALAIAGLGILAAAYGWMNIQTAISNIGPVGSEITAPSYAEALLVLAYALVVAGLALLFAVGARLRAGAPEKA